MKKSNNFSRIISAVGTFVVITFLILAFCITFLDIFPTWRQLFGKGSAFDNEGDYVYFLNVGEGDAILIRSNGRYVLIDTGDGETTNIVKTLNKHGVKGLDALILTHWHSDHVGAADEILKEFKVLNLVTAKLPVATDELYKPATEINSIAKENNVSFSLAVNGLAINVGDFKLTVLYYDSSNTEENNRSIVIMANCRDSKFLLTGDAEEALENEIIDYGINIDCDVLKIAHHGSKNSTSDNFLKNSSPEYAVISVGRENSYGHPNSSVLDKLYYKDIKVLRTDYVGDVVFEVLTDGVELLSNTN